MLNVYDWQGRVDIILVFPQTALRVFQAHTEPQSVSPKPPETRGKSLEEIGEIFENPFQ